MSEQNTGMREQDIHIGDHVKVHDRSMMDEPVWGKVVHPNGSYKLVNVEFNPPTLSKYFERGAQSSHRDRGGSLPFFVESEVLEVRRFGRNPEPQPEAEAESQTESQLNVGDRVKAYDQKMMSRPVMGTVRKAPDRQTVFRVELDEALTDERRGGYIRSNHCGGTTYQFYREELTKVTKPQSFEVGQRVRVVANHGPTEFDRYVGLFGTIKGNFGVHPGRRYAVEIDTDGGPETVAATHDELEAVDITAMYGSQTTSSLRAERDRLTESLSEVTAQRDRAGERIERLNDMLSEERNERAKAERKTQEVRNERDRAENRIEVVGKENDRLRTERDTAIEKVNKLEAEKRSGQTSGTNPGREVPADSGLKVGDYIECTCRTDCPAKGRIKSFSENGRQAFVDGPGPERVLVRSARKVQPQEDQPRTPGEVRVGDLVKTSGGLFAGRIATVATPEEGGFRVNIPGMDKGIWKLPTNLEVVRRAS